MRAIRPHQERAIHELRAALASKSKRVMLQAPTGAGKTLLSAHIISLARAKGNRVIFTVPAISLVDQTVTEFEREGITGIGVLQADHERTDPSQPVQVASIQTLARREIPPADLVMIDEAHQMSDFVRRWMESEDWLDVPFIGLSATPWSKGLGRYYDRLIVAATTADLIRDGYLSPFRVFAPSHPDLRGVRISKGDYHEGDLSAVMSDQALVADVVDTWIKLGEDRPTLCFAVDRVHAKTLQAQFLAKGVPCGYVDAFTTRMDRARLRDQFQSGEIKVVCNVGVLTTGIDWDVRCLILARPTKSEILFTQIVGRGLRTAPDKDNCLILDHSDTTQRLGFVTDIHHPRLCDGTPKSKRAHLDDREAQPKECPKCHYLRAPKVKGCPACGYVPERISDVETIDGELVEVGRKAKPKPMTQRQFYAELLGYAQQVGKTRKFALAIFRAKHGSWPRGADGIFPEPPSPETVSFVRSRLIAYAKGRQKEQEGRSHAAR